MASLPLMVARIWVSSPPNLLQPEIGDEGYVKEVLQDEEAEGEASEDADSGRALPAKPQGTHGTNVLGFTSFHTLHQAKLQQAAQSLRR